MSVQQAIDRLTSLTNAAGAQSDVRDVARIAYMNSQATQAALSAVVTMLQASGTLPKGVWEKALESAYLEQCKVLEGAARSILLAPGGKA
jgi:hypothetical protein